MDNFVGLLMKKDCEVERLLILKVDAQKPTNTAGVSTQLLVDCGDSGFWPRQNQTRQTKSRAKTLRFTYRGTTPKLST